MGQDRRDFEAAGADPAWDGLNAGVDLLARESVVVIDADRHRARALLLDVVDGAARFVAISSAPATALPPYGDAAIGINAAVRQLEQRTGRRFLADDQLISPQQPNGDGADVIYLTGSPLGPVRTALISLDNDELTRAVMRAVRRAPAILADLRDELPGSAPTMASSVIAEWLKLVAPRTVIIIMSAQSVAGRAAVFEAIADAKREAGIRQGIVIGDDPSQQAVAQALGNGLDLSGIDPGEYEPRDIAIAIEDALRADHAHALEHEGAPRPFGGSPFVDGIQAAGAVVAFLHRRMHRNVLFVSSGDGTLLQAALRDGQVTHYRGEVDLGFGARSLLRIPPERVTRWLPFRWSPEEVAEWLLNRSLRPFVEPDGATDLAVMAAARREMLSWLLEESDLGAHPPVDLIALGPGLIADDLALTVLAALDGVGPAPAEGVVTIALDEEGLIAGVGAVSADDPSFAGEVIEQDCLRPVATCVVVSGSGEDGELAVRGELIDATGETRRFSVPYGSLHVLPLPEGETARLSLTPEAGFQVGAHPPGEPVVFEGERQLFGGEIGVVIDARGRPIGLPGDDLARVARLKSWIEDLGGRPE